MRHRDIITLDGEGMSPEGVGGPHWYTLLNAYHSGRREHRHIERWSDGGLTTECILEFLLRLPYARRQSIACGFFLNYDITMWLSDLTGTEKTALWNSGWLVHRGARSGRHYWLEYIPSKMFFVGRYTLDMGLRYTKYRWPRDKPHRMIYDVSGFSQKSFVSTLADWQSEIGISDVELAALAEMKGQRAAFSAESQEEQRAYNRAECEWLARYVLALDKTFQAEGITLHSWHGPGAIAAHYMKREKIHATITDPTSALALHGIMGAYTGGRSELFSMGKFDRLFNYDINSAYPAQAARLPDLSCGRWRFCTPDGVLPEWGVFYVSFDYRGTPYRVMPFPFRLDRQVFYPDSGEGWYHACEIRAAQRYYPLGVLQVHYGYEFQPATSALPFGYIHDLAQRRLAYKAAGDRRAVPLKFGLNSMYGKLAQHAAQVGQTPPFQSYFSAGYITAATRVRLLEFIWQTGYTDADVVMLATDGVFCTKERAQLLGGGLGEYEHSATLHDVYVVQPGVWYSAEGRARTRGFGAKSLQFDQVQAVWDTAGIYARLTYTETRFVGLGASVGTGDFGQCGTWQEGERELVFYPSRKFPKEQGVRARYTLLPTSMAGRESEPYVPHAPADHAPAMSLYKHLAGLVARHDQPDM